jgi:hypothetical protein
MHVRREELRAGLHRANGVLNWRGVPENHPVREHLDQFGKIVAELDRCFDEASRDQIDALREAHDHITRSMPELLGQRSENGLVLREAEMLRALLDAANRHLHVWSSLRTRIEYAYVDLMSGESAGRSSVDTRKKRAKAKVTEHT